MQSTLAFHRERASATARALALPLLVLALAGAISPAAVAEDLGYRSYRCNVLGDSNACTVAPPSEPELAVHRRIVLGPYAHYLMSQRGLSPEAARSEAASIGEYPELRVVSVKTRALTGFERYERWAGRAVAPERTEVTLSTTTLGPTSDQIIGQGPSQ